MSTTATPSRPTGWRRVVQRLQDWWPDVAAFVGALVCAGLAAVFAGLIGGCGGGVGTEGTGSFASGTISGYGSIIVNGVHFDQSTAAVNDDDNAAVDRAALALGMVVDVTAGPISTAADGSLHAVATVVRTNRALVGPVGAVDGAGGRLTVLGQTVRVPDGVPFDAGLSGGLAGLSAGQVLEIYGYFDNASGSYLATRIGRPTTDSLPRVSGVVGAVSAQGFTIGSQTYSLALLGGTAPAPGSQVRLKLRSSDTDDNGRWEVDARRSDDRAPEDHDGAKLEGVVSRLTAAGFVVNGITVESSVVPSGGSLVVGARVEVNGTLRGGVLRASAVTVESTGGSTTQELNGRLASLDSANQRFVLRSGQPDITVSWNGSTQFRDGASPAALVGYTGKLKVKGQLLSGGTVLQAQSIEFDD